jgi:hypothetical protein
MMFERYCLQTFFSPLTPSGVLKTPLAAQGWWYSSMKVIDLYLEKSLE